MGNFKYLGSGSKAPKSFWFGLLASGALLFAACGSSAPVNSSSAAPSTSSSSSKSPYVVNAILSLTGPGSFLGTREDKALHALASEMNKTGGIDGHPIEIKAQDNRSNASTAVSLATPLVSSGVSVIFNGSLTAPDKAVDALASSNGPFIYDLSPIENPPSGSMIFAAGTPLSLDAEAYLTFLKSKGYDRIAIITSTDASGVGGYKQLVSSLKSPQFSSIHLVANQSFDPSAVSATTQLSVIKAAKPQALIIWTTGSPLGTVLNGMSALGMEDIPTITDNGNTSYAELHHFASVLPKDFYFPTPLFYLPASKIPNSQVRSKVETFDKAISAIGGHPGNPYAYGWDPATLVFDALKKLGIHATAKQILQYMQNLHNVPGVFGLYNTSTEHHHGLNVSDIVMTNWTGHSFAQASGPGGTALNNNG